MKRLFTLLLFVAIAVTLWFGWRETSLKKEVPSKGVESSMAEITEEAVLIAKSIKPKLASTQSPSEVREFLDYQIAKLEKLVERLKRLIRRFPPSAYSRLTLALDDLKKWLSETQTFAHSRDSAVLSKIKEFGSVAYANLNLANQANFGTIYFEKLEADNLDIEQELRSIFLKESARQITSPQAQSPAFKETSPTYLYSWQNKPPVPAPRVYYDELKPYVIAYNQIRRERNLGRLTSDIRANKPIDISFAIGVLEDAITKREQIFSRIQALHLPPAIKGYQQVILETIANGIQALRILLNAFKYYGYPSKQDIARFSAMNAKNNQNMAWLRREFGIK